MIKFSLPSKSSFSEIGGGKKISSLTSSPNLSIDKVSDKFEYENNYSYEGANKEEKNENISVKSGENNEDNKKLVIYSSFSEINKKKDIGFVMLDKKVVAEGTPDEVFKSKVFIDTFGEV